MDIWNIDMKIKDLDNGDNRDLDMEVDIDMWRFRILI